MLEGSRWAIQAALFLPGFTPERWQHFASPFGDSVSLFGKWRCGQNSTCAMGCQEGRWTPRASHSVLPPPAPVLQRRGPGAMALGSLVTMWPRRGQASMGGVDDGAAWPWLRSPEQPRLLPPEGLRPCQGPLPAHCCPRAWGQMGAAGHSQAQRRRPRRQLLPCSAVRAAQTRAAHEAALHTRVTDTLLRASAKTHRLA